MADLKRTAESDGLHGERGVGGETVVASHAVGGPGTQAHAGDAVGLEKDARIALVGLFENAVIRGGLQRIVFAELAIPKSNVFSTATAFPARRHSSGSGSYKPTLRGQGADRKRRAPHRIYRSGPSEALRCLLKSAAGYRL